MNNWAHSLTSSEGSLSRDWCGPFGQSWEPRRMLSGKFVRQVSHSPPPGWEPGPQISMQGLLESLKEEAENFRLGEKWEVSLWAWRVKGRLKVEFAENTHSSFLWDPYTNIFFILPLSQNIQNRIRHTAGIIKTYLHCHDMYVIWIFKLFFGKLNNYVLQRIHSGKTSDIRELSILSTQQRWTLEGGAKEGRRMWEESLGQNSADFKIWLTQILIPPREMSLKTCWLNSICSLKLSGPTAAPTLWSTPSLKFAQEDRSKERGKLAITSWEVQRS